MFGYVNVLQDELKIKEFKVFKAYYCGLCKRQGELFGNTSRLSLSYDFTALAIILDSLSDEPARICEGRCMLHPLKKRPVARDCDALSYSAAMSVALSYFKIKDDIADSGFSARAAESTSPIGDRLPPPASPRISATVTSGSSAPAWRCFRVKRVYLPSLAR